MRIVFRYKSPVKGNLINAKGYVDRREIKKKIIIVYVYEGVWGKVRKKMKKKKEARE